MPLVYRHPGFCALRVRPGAAVFLKAYTTNVIDAPRSAFLTREGKTVAAVWQSKISEDEALLAVAKPFAEPLLAHLSKYLALSDTKFEPVTGSVYVDLSNGAWDVSDAGKPASASAEDYLRFRVERKIPEQGTDFTDEMPLCVDPSLVHFEKGCYLGQEIVARVHYRGAPSKKLEVKSQSECTADEFRRMTSKLTINKEVKGFVFVLK